MYCRSTSYRRLETLVLRPYAPSREPSGCRLGVCVSIGQTQKSPVGAQTPCDRAFSFHSLDNEDISMQRKIQARRQAVRIAQRIGRLQGGHKRRAIMTLCRQLRIMLGVRA